MENQIKSQIADKYRMINHAFSEWRLLQRQMEAAEICWLGAKSQGRPYFVHFKRVMTLEKARDRVIENANVKCDEIEVLKHKLHELEQDQCHSNQQQLQDQD